MTDDYLKIDTSSAPPGVFKEARKVLNIYQRIHAVMTELDSVAKVRVTEARGAYKYIGHDDVTGALQPLFVKHGIAQSVTIDELSRDEKQMVRVVLTVSWLNVEKPEDRHAVRAIGESACTNKDGRGDDLQIGKAVSYAVKVAQLKNFALVGDTTADNEAAQPREQARQPAPPPKDPIADVVVDALLGQYEAATTRSQLNAIRKEIADHLARMTQAQEDRLAEADQAAAGRIG